MGAIITPVHKNMKMYRNSFAIRLEICTYLVEQLKICHYIQYITCKTLVWFKKLTRTFLTKLYYWLKFESTYTRLAYEKLY